MARPKQDGLLYFSFDTDFFYADQRIKRLHSRYGSDGMIFYIYLLTEIYRNGYYIRWDRESVDNAMDDLHLTEGLIEQAMAFLVSRSLLMKRTLADSDTVITSPGIQKRYQEAIKSRKRDVYVDADIWLLDENETAPFIKVTGNGDKSCGNEGKSCGNWSKSCGNGIKESKVKESKENNIAPSGEAQGTETLEAFYESIWQLYPIKKGKGQVSKAKKKALQRIGFPHIKRCVERFIADMESSGRERKYWMHGSTFFNSGYVDYLDGNWDAGSIGDGLAPPGNLPHVAGNVQEAGGPVYDGEEWWKYGPNGMEG